ncbi:diacylglyceryl transferase [Gammaproteobacteria bacterium ESL0073]|nr:diacylglyceryl transferase [Gammaproteobacteria bacterium ESL0073]
MTENKVSILTPKVIKLAAARELEKLMSVTTGIESAVLTTEDGFEVAFKSIDNAVDPSKLAAMASSLSAISNMSIFETNLGTEYNSIIIESDKGYIVIMDIDNEAFPMILNVVASKNAVLGQILYHTRAVVEAFNRKV